MSEEQAIGSPQQYAGDFLYILRSGPDSTAAGQECLDAILAATALEVEIAVLFTEDGVHHLTPGRDFSASARRDCTYTRDYAKGFRALPDLGVAQIYVDKLSAETRGLRTFTVSTEPLEAGQIEHLVKQFQRVLVF